MATRIASFFCITVTIVGLMIVPTTSAFSGASSRHMIQIAATDTEGTMLALGTDDQDSIGLILRDESQGRNIAALLTETPPEEAKDLFRVLSADSVLRVGADSIGGFQPSFLIEDDSTTWAHLSLLVVKLDGSITALPIDIVGYDGTQISIEIEEQPAKVSHRCFLYTASSGGCGTFSKTCCGSGQVCIDYTDCTITCSGCTT